MLGGGLVVVWWWLGVGVGGYLLTVLSRFGYLQFSFKGVDFEGYIFEVDKFEGEFLP